MTSYQLDCPACSFEETISAAGREALDAAADHADNCATLPTGAVVTLERQPEAASRSRALDD